MMTIAVNEIGIRVAMMHGISAEKKIIIEMETKPTTNFAIMSSEPAMLAAGRNISAIPVAIAWLASMVSGRRTTQAKG